MKRVINGKTYSKVIGVKKGELAVFDSDGELKSSGKKPCDIHDSELPSGGTNGQVLTKKTNGVEWKDVPTELPTIGSDDSRKVLAVNSGATGVEWVTSSGGGKLYSHNILMTTQGMNAACSIITKNSEQFTVLTFGNYLYDNGFNAPEKCVAASGKTSTEVVIGMHAASGGALMWTTIQSNETIGVTGTGGLTFSDIVIEL